MPVVQRHDREILGADLGRLPVDRRTDTASIRHCCDIGSPLFSRSTIGRRSARPRIKSSGFVPKNRSRPSTDRSAGREDQPALRWPFPPPPHRRPRKHSPRRRAAASSSCRSGSDETRTGSPARPAGHPGSPPAPPSPPACAGADFEPRVVLLACPLHVLLLRHWRFLGAGLHLNQLSHFRRPAHPAPSVTLTRPISAY
jgi:hypothetical protein